MYTVLHRFFRLYGSTAATVVGRGRGKVERKGGEGLEKKVWGGGWKGLITVGMERGMGDWKGERDQKVKGQGCVTS